jgi:hypothetical protein
MQALKTEPARLFAISTGLVSGAIVAGVLAASLTAAPARAAGSDSGFSAGLQVKATAKAADIGVPVYPGAVPKPGEGEDSHGATIGMHWGSLFGLKVVALKYTSPEPIAAVAGYYRDALGRHGAVLDCSHGVPRAPGPQDPKSNALRCDKDWSSPGEVVYKVGTKDHQRIVALRPAAVGVDFDLVRVEVRGD